MKTEIIGRGYEIIWSLVAIGGGLSLLLFSKELAQSNARTFEALFERTKLRVFKWQAQEMTKPYMDLLGKALGVAFVIVGVLILLGHIHFG